MKTSVLLTIVPSKKFRGLAPLFFQQRLEEKTPRYLAVKADTSPNPRNSTLENRAKFITFYHVLP